MANLETLELTINANAESAVKSIDKLATHLVALGQAIQKPLQQLTALAHQLQTISKANVSNVVSGVRTAGGSRPGNRNIAAGGTPLSQSEALAMLNSSQTDLLTQKSQAMAKAYVENAMAGNLNNQQLAEGALRVKAVTNQIEKLNQAENETSESTGKFKDIWQAITKSFAGAMVIGTVMKSIKKGFQEAWQGAYKFSKSVGGDFAKGIDTIKGSLQGVAISLVQTLAPAINVIAPIVNVLANVIKYLCDAIKELLTWMGITSEMFGNTMDKISGFAGASKKAAKESSSAFDELNVIGSNSGGDSGASSTSGLFSDKITDELAKIQLAVGEAMIAIGLILAFTGHIGLGVGMIAIGAAALVKTFVNDWGGLTQDIKDELATITAIVGVASLAIGTILAFSGKIGLGVGLIALGVANLVAAVAVKDTLTPDVKKKITNITAIVGGSLLAIGAILCFTGAGIPLGIGLMLAGAASLAAAVAINWDGIGSKIKKAFSGVTKWLQGVWDKVAGAVTSAWNAVKTWWESSGIGPKVRKAWEDVSSFFSGMWNGIKSAATKAWDKAKQWWDTNVTENVKKGGVWGGIKGFFSGVFNSIKKSIGQAWDKWLSWTGIKWSDIKKKWNDVKKGLQDVWDKVKTSVTNAWDKVKKWWESSGLQSKVMTAWSGARQYLYNAWDSVKTSVTNAWNKVVAWWTTTSLREKVSNAWDSAKKYLSDAWTSVKTSVTNAWDNVKKWWETSNLGTKVTNAWSTARKYLYNAFSNVKSSIALAWNNVKKWWETSNIGGKVTNAWKSARRYLSDAWDTVKGSISNAWDRAKEWWTTNVTENVQKNGAWGGVVGFFKGIVGDSERGIIGEFNAAYAEMSRLWGDIIGKVEGAWKSVSTWFHNNVTRPIGNFFIDMINGLIDGINWFIRKLNTINIKIPALKLPLIGTVWSETTIGISGIQILERLNPIQPKANGDYGIPKGDLFIANEKGAELVGTMNGKTTVANQQQIVDGIANGVAAANAEQNALLRRQNELLSAILQKTGSISPSSTLGKVVNQSLQMYGSMTGV